MAQGGAPATAPQARPRGPAVRESEVEDKIVPLRQELRLGDERSGLRRRIIGVKSIGDERPRGPCGWSGACQPQPQVPVLDALEILIEAAHRTHYVGTDDDVRRPRRDRVVVREVGHHGLGSRGWPTADYP